MQKFLNNFNTTFIAAVKDVAVTGTPATELDYGILRISDGAAGMLTNPTGGDHYILTTYKKSGTAETNTEIMRVTAVDNSTVNECRITVLRAQEGTTAKAYVSGDYVSLRLTAGGTNEFAQTSALALKANLASPTFTGTVGGITAAMVGAQAVGGLPVATVTGTTQTAVAGTHYVLTNVAATTVTLPASPASGDTVAITVANSLTTNIIARNGQTIMGLAEDMTIDTATATVTLRFLNGSWRLI